MLHIRKRIKNVFRWHPVERSHGESVITSLPDSKLFGEVIEGIEGVTSIEFLIVFLWLRSTFPLCRGVKGLIFLCRIPSSASVFKERQRLFPAVAHLISKFKPIISLNTLNSVGKLFHYMFQKLCGRVCTLLLECFKIAKATVFVDEGILIVFLLAASPTRQAAGTYFTSICPRCPGYSIFS